MTFVVYFLNYEVHFVKIEEGAVSATVHPKILAEVQSEAPDFEVEPVEPTMFEGPRSSVQKIQKC